MKHLETREEKIHALYNLLCEVHKELLKGPQKINLITLTRKYKIHTMISGFVIQSKLIKKEGNGIYSWVNLSEKPTEGHAKIIFDNYEKVNKNNQRAKQKKKQKENIKEKTITPSVSSDKIADAKKFLDSMYNIMNGVKHHIEGRSLRLSEHAAKYKLDTIFVRALSELKILDRVGVNKAFYSYKWIGDKPSTDMVESIFLHRKKIMSKQYKKLKTEPVKRRSKSNQETENGVTLYKEPPVVIHKSKASVMVELAKLFVEHKEYDTALDVMKNA